MWGRPFRAAVKRISFLGTGVLADQGRRELAHAWSLYIGN